MTSNEQAEGSTTIAIDSNSQEIQGGGILVEAQIAESERVMQAHDIQWAIEQVAKVITEGNIREVGQRAMNREIEARNKSNRKAVER